MNGQPAYLIDTILAQVETAIARHHAGEAAPLSTTLLQNISADLRRVRAGWPLLAVGCGHAVSDWPEESELRKDLLDAAYRLERARQKQGSRHS